MNLAPTHFLCHHMGYPDRELAADLSIGVQIVGSVPPTGASRPLLRPPRLDIEAWRASLPEWNREIVPLVAKTGIAELSRLCLGKTVADAQLGWIARPIPVTEFALDTAPSSPRFGIWEQRGTGDREIRAIGDLKASKINDLQGLAETSVPESPGVFMAMTLARGYQAPQADMRAFSVDSPHSYRQVGISTGKLDFAMRAV